MNEQTENDEALADSVVPAPAVAPAGWIALRYIGGDPANRFIPGVPASDHAVESTEEAEALAATGMYEIEG